MSTTSPVSVARRRRWPWFVVIGLLLLVVVRGLVVETFTVPSASMSPTLTAGDRIVVWKPGAADLHRGDIVVFDGAGVFSPRDASGGGGLAGAIRSVGDTFGFRTGETDYVKRVIGLPGDRVQVGADGVLKVNGNSVDEDYLAAGVSSSATPFDVRVPSGRVFVMGDNRTASDDSRAHLGDPGGGTVPVDQVIGTVTWRYWPLGSWGTLPR